MAPSDGNAGAGTPPTSGPARLFRKRPPKPKTYKLRPEGLTRYQWEAILGTAAVLATAGIAGLYGTDLRRISLDSPVLIVLFFFIAAVVGLLVGLQILGQAWNSYRLTLHREKMVLKQTQRPDVEIRRSEILRVEERPGVGLRVLTLSRGKKIEIPVSVERFAEVRAHLSNWRVLEQPRPRSLFERWPATTMVGISAAGVLTLTVLIRAEEPAVIIPAGLLLLAGGGWGLYEIQRSPHLDRRIKWSSWIGLVGLWPAAEKVLRAILR